MNNVGHFQNIGISVVSWNGWTRLQIPSCSRPSWLRPACY